MFKRKSQARAHRSTFPDYYFPIFQQCSLTDYNPSSYRCETVLPDPPDPLSSSQPSAIETRGKRRGYDAADHRFYHEQKRLQFPASAYSDTFLTETTQNPCKWYEIGVAFNPQHASIIIHDMTGTNTDNPEIQFEYIGIEGKAPTSFVEGEVQRLHFVNRDEAGGFTLHDLLLEDVEAPKDFQSYYTVFRLRTTIRTIKYNASLSFPRYYKMVASDCATFALNFLIRTLTVLYNEDQIEKLKFDDIVENLVEHNHIKNGPVGESEAASRRDKALAESGGTVAGSSVATGY